MGSRADAGVAQLVEQRFRKPQVARSIRVAGSIPCLTRPGTLTLVLGDGINPLQCFFDSRLSLRVGRRLFIDLSNLCRRINSSSNFFFWMLLVPSRSTTSRRIRALPPVSFDSALPVGRALFMVVSKSKFFPSRMFPLLQFGHAHTLRKWPFAENQAQVCL